MVFVSICRALYDYIPQGDNELAIEEGELLYIVEKSTEDDWWKAKKRPPAEDEEEPVGLIPNNYVQEASPSHYARALYDYARQTDEELSFSEDAQLSVYDTSDPDWTLVGWRDEYGFAPANYIEILGASHPSPDTEEAAPALPARKAQPEVTNLGPVASSISQSTPAYLGEIQNRLASRSPASDDATSPPASAARKAQAPQFTPEDSEDDTPAPSLPQRPPSQQITPQIQYVAPLSPDSDGVAPSPPFNRAVAGRNNNQPSGGFHMYHINEMVSAIGKNKKMPTALGLNVGTGNIMLAPEKSKDGPQQEWSAEKLQHYSIEGKHVFMELVRPSKSVDLHAGNKDTATEIVSHLGEIAGAARAEGLREILEISEGSQRRGRMLYEFMAQQDDEVSVDLDDEVLILDDTKSDEWWVVRRVKNGKEGVVPSSYVEPISRAPPEPSSTGLNIGKSMKEQNRLEEERMAKEAVKRSKSHKKSDSQVSEAGPGLKLPDRGSSLMSKPENKSGSLQKSRKDQKSEKSADSKNKTKPDISKTRTWTDRSGSFKVEAQFLGLKEGKIHLHKLNGVKIAVPVTKMAAEDLEYVERVTGQSLDDEKPLSDIRRRSTQVKKGDELRKDAKSPPGASIGSSRPTPKGPEYDWFDFFLKAGVSPYQCQRYTDNFNKDSMDETILPDITASVLRTLGLKEGDTLRVMKYLDSKYGRTGSAARANSGSATDADGNEEEAQTPGGLFSGPGGTLRNNTRKGRPAPTIQTNNSVSADTFKQSEKTAKPGYSAHKTATPLSGLPTPPKDVGSFDDDAWDVKPASQAPPQSQKQTSAASRPTPSEPPRPPTGAMADLSLLTPALQPTPSQNTQPQIPPPPIQPSQQQPPASVPSPPNTQPSVTGANPAFFSQLDSQPTGLRQNQPSSIPTFNMQPSTMQPQLTSAPRQRPQAPEMPQQQTSFLPPPPRPLSAPQNAPQSNTFGPPAILPQLTGYQPSQINRQLIAPQGQSLDEMSALRRQQILYQSQPPLPQQTGLQMPNQGSNQLSNGFISQPTGFQQQQLPPQPTGFQNANQFSGNQYVNGGVNPQPTGFQQMASQSIGLQPQFQGSLQPQPTGINSFLPPALQPQPTGVNGFGGRPGFGQPPTPAPPLPPIPQQPTAQPLMPQKTGPAPPVSFGAQKLVPQPTGRRANLSQATPENPFGF